ncbi:MAG: hypothetical protein VYA54_05705 [Bdellovibrionota bacterium]|nr:hypothetical protein [Bdellovibrionota bacterium]
MFSQPQQVTKNTGENQSGQTLVEFILLLSAISIISFSFMRVVNSSISERWQKMAQTILDDNNQQLQIR